MEKRARLVLAVTAALLGGMLWWHSKQAEPAVQVRTAAVTVRDVYNSITVTGQIEAGESTVLCPAENALVSAVAVSVGDSVEQGEVLCLLRSETTDAAALSDGVQTAWKALSGGQAQTVQAEETQVLRAPVAGTVLSMPAAGDRVYTGIPCVRIADLDSLRVSADCPELYAGQLEPGQRANVTVTALDDRTYGAVLESMAPVAVRAVSLTGSSGEATVETRLALSGDPDGLRPGYSATVKIFTEQHEDAVTVPLEAICQRGEQEYVFCTVAGRAVQCPVKTGYFLEDSVELTDGVEPGAVVILSPPDDLTNGAAVEVIA